jgi:hypothetical protein
LLLLHALLRLTRALLLPLLLRGKWGASSLPALAMRRLLRLLRQLRLSESK